MRIPSLKSSGGRRVSGEGCAALHNKNEVSASNEEGASFSLFWSRRPQMLQFRDGAFACFVFIMREWFGKIRNTPNESIKRLPVSFKSKWRRGSLP